MAQETEYTTITVPATVKDQLDEHRKGRPWAVYLEQLRREHADPLTFNDAQSIADHVAKEVGSDVDEGELALAVCDYLITEYNLPEKLAQELQR